MQSQREKAVLDLPANKGFQVQRQLRMLPCYKHYNIYFLKACV